MVDLAGIGSLIGAGGSIFSGLMGAGQSNAALKAAMLQYQLQKRIADQQYELATAGTQDPRGNKTRYVPGIGWISEPTPTTRSILGASDREELSRLQQDAPRTRRGKQFNEQRRMQESPIADALLRNIKGDVGAISEPTMRSRIGDVLLSDITDKSNFAKEAIAMQAGRTGERGNARRVASEIDANTRSGVRGALARARYDAPVEANRQNTELRNANLNRYNLLATRASNVEDFPFAPTEIAKTPDANIARSMVMGPQALMGASAAAGKGFESLLGGMNYAKKNAPDYGLMASGLTEALENMFRKGTTKHEQNYGAF